MNRILHRAAVLAILAAGVFDSHADERGKEVVVIYNTRVPESKGVADHYAQRRGVPSAQVLGFDLPALDAISRMDYSNRLELPLANALRTNGFFQFGSREVTTTNGTTERVDGVVTNATIRYAVLCYGIPVKIGPNPGLQEEGAEHWQKELRRNEAAIDSELACLPLLERHYPRTGPLSNKFYGTTNAASLDPTNGILLVARLDGPTADIARNLVDKALFAETNGLWGRAYFDLRGLTSGELKVGDDWLRGAAEACRLLGFETVVDDNPGTFPPGFPLSEVAFYAGWYDENVSGPFAQPTVEFMPGAFAYHLHSFSAANLHLANRNWTGALLAKGVTATMGTVDEPYLMLTPNMAVFFARFIYSGFTFGEAAYACSGYLSWQTTVVGDPLYRPFGKNPLEQAREMAQQHSPFMDWAYLRLTDLKLAEHTPVPAVVENLENIAMTKQSAVLMAKLADLYALEGKPSSSVYALRQVLKLKSTPQERIRVMLLLIPRLLDLEETSDAYDTARQLLQEFPNYPDRAGILHQLINLAQKLGRGADAAKYEAELNRPNKPPAAMPTAPPLRRGI